MAKLIPLNSLQVLHEYTAGTWQDFTGDLAAATVALREGVASHTAALSFYRANMDPSQSSASTVVKKGDRVRLLAKNPAGTLRLVGTFRIVKIAVDIDLTRPAAYQHRVTINIAGAGYLGIKDAPQTKGVASVPELADVITGAPFEINGDGFGTGTTTATGTSVEATSVDTATEADQVALTRDSNPGTIVFEDPNGRIQIFDSAAYRTGAAALSLDANKYRNIDLRFDLSHVVNIVQYKYLEKIKSTGKATRVKEHSVTYRDTASIAKYGPCKRVITTHKKSDFAAHASAIFARNADPAAVPVTVTIPMRSAADLLPGYEDGVYVGHKVTVIHPDGTTTYACRIGRIVHTITPDSWVVTLHLRHQDVIQKPRPVATGLLSQPGAQTEVANTPDGTVLTAHLDDDAVDGRVLAPDTVDGTHLAPVVDGDGVTIQNALISTGPQYPQVKIAGGSTGPVGFISIKPASDTFEGLIIGEATSGVSAQLTLKSPRPATGTRTPAQAVLWVATDFTTGPHVQTSDNVPVIAGGGFIPAVPGVGSMKLTGLYFGSFSGTADANGLVVISHGLGVVPTMVLVTSRTGNRNCAVNARTATTFTVRTTVADSNTLLTTGQAVSVDWLALA